MTTITRRGNNNDSYQQTAAMTPAAAQAVTMLAAAQAVMTQAAVQAVMTQAAAQAATMPAAVQATQAAVAARPLLSYSRDHFITCYMFVIC